MRRHSPLPLHAAAAYTLLVIYASLHPFSGWRSNGAAPLDFMGAAWPHYFTVFDLITNVIAYVPLGFLWVPAMQLRFPRWAAMLATLLIAFSLSLGMETLQNYLPSRVPSNLDFGTNCLGGLGGALLGLRWGRVLLSGGWLHELRVSWIVGGNVGETGLLLLGAWLLTQLSPIPLLFGSGDVRSLLGLGFDLPFDVERFGDFEAAVTAANTVAVGLVLSCLLRRNLLAGVILLFLAALFIRSFSYALLVAPDKAFLWSTPGNARGLLIGLLLLLPLPWLSIPWRRALAGSVLLLATVLVNLVPENPYLTQAALAWRQGHFLNFNGLTRLASILWPFAALPWLLLKEHKDE